MFQEQGSGTSSRKVPYRERKKRTRQRRKKSTSNVKEDADGKSENTEKDKKEIIGNQTQESVPLETQHAGPQAEDNLQKGGEQHHRDAKMVQAQTQTWKLKGKDKVTQTPAAVQSNKETQTDFPVPERDEKTQPGTNNAAETQRKHDKHTPEPMLQDDNAGQTQLRQNEKPDNDGASSESAKEQNANLNKESKSEEAGPSAGVSGDPTDRQAEKGAKPMSYAKAVSGDGSSEKQPNMAATETADKTTKTSQNTR